jgi:hypothetical protein
MKRSFVVEIDWWRSLIQFWFWDRSQCLFDILTPNRLRRLNSFPVNTAQGAERIVNVRAILGVVDHVRPRVQDTRAAKSVCVPASPIYGVDEDVDDELRIHTSKRHKTIII